MDEHSKKFSELFMSLVVSFQMGALQHLGKLVNPFTGKAEGNLEAAAADIDLLDMLAEKTKGNLTPEEARTLNETISLLKLNYVEEVNKPPTEPTPSPTEKSPTAGAETPPHQTT